MTQAQVAWNTKVEMLQHLGRIAVTSALLASASTLGACQAYAVDDGFGQAACSGLGCTPAPACGEDECGEDECGEDGECEDSPVIPLLANFFEGCAADPVVVDTLEFFLPDDPSLVLVANVWNEALGTSTMSPLSQPFSGDTSFRVKFGDPDAYELHTWDDQNIYLRYDHTWGEGPNGASSYEFLEAPGKGGRWMKRHMQVGEEIAVAIPGEGMRTFYDDCSEEGRYPLHYRNALRYHCGAYDLGALGTDEVIVLEYRYFDGSGYEDFFYSKRWGWVRWVQFRNVGGDFVPEMDVFWNEIEMCGGVPCAALQPVEFCVSSEPLPPAGPDALARGDSLLPGAERRSVDGRFSVVYQVDGNLVIYELGTGLPLWWSGTAGSSAGLAAMQEDGNLVVYDAAGLALWSTGTVGRGERLTMQSDGNLVVRDAAGAPAWTSGTGGH